MLVPYKKWLLAKQRRRLSGSWDRDMRSHSGGFDDLDMFDVVQSPQFKARFAEIIGMGTETQPAKGRVKINHVEGDCPRVFQRIMCLECGYTASEARYLSEDDWLNNETYQGHTKAPIRGRAVPCIDVDDTKGHTPKGED